MAALSIVNSQKIYMTKPRIGGTHELDLILPRAGTPQRATQTESKALMPYVTVGKENGENKTHDTSSPVCGIYEVFVTKL